MNFLRVELSIKLFDEEVDKEIFESEISFSGLSKKEGAEIKNNLLLASILHEDSIELKRKPKK